MKFAYFSLPIEIAMRKETVKNNKRIKKKKFELLKNIRR